MKEAGLILPGLPLLAERNSEPGLTHFHRARRGFHQKEIQPLEISSLRFPSPRMQGGVHTQRLRRPSPLPPAPQAAEGAIPVNQSPRLFFKVILENKAAQGDLKAAPNSPLFFCDSPTDL